MIGRVCVLIFFVVASKCELIATKHIASTEDFGFRVYFYTVSASSTDQHPRFNENSSTNLK